MLPKTILLVDDEPDVILVVRGRLKTWGYQVIIAMNGQEALEAVDRQIPDLILMDLKMPVMGGKETCLRLKSDPRFSKIPIILITSSTQQAATAELLAVRADDCIIKPFDPKDLLAKIQKSIG